jgi:hypothetical protein
LEFDPALIQSSAAFLKSFGESMGRLVVCARIVKNAAYRPWSYRFSESGMVGFGSWVAGAATEHTHASNHAMD